MKQEIAPCDFVVPDKIIDRTKTRPQSFFGDGVCGHVYFAEPFCSYLSGPLYSVIKDAGHRDEDCETAPHNAAATAIFTDPDYLPLETRRKLDLFYQKYWSHL